MKAWAAMGALFLTAASGLTASQFRGVPGGQGCASAAEVPPSQPLAVGDFVELERTACYGLCPVYTVRIRADGKITWTGRSNVQVSGDQAATLPVEAARALIEQFRTAEFWNLCGSYPKSTDSPSTLVTARIGGREKRVSNGPGPGSIAALLDLEFGIDRAADTHRWIHGDPQKELMSSGPIRSDGAGGKPGWTPLMQAASVADNSRMQVLLAAKADPNARDASGWTALVYAAHSLKARSGTSSTDPSEIAAVKMLLDSGAKPDARSFMDQTPLMAAVMAPSSSLDKARLLIAAGADVNAQDKNGQTVLMLIVRGSLRIRPAGIGDQEVELCSMLRAAGARTDLRDATGLTVFDILDQELKPWTVLPLRSGVQDVEAKYAGLRRALQ